MVCMPSGRDLMLKEPFAEVLCVLVLPTILAFAFSNGSWSGFVTKTRKANGKEPGFMILRLFL